MASLEELLAEEGFKKKRSMMRPSSSVRLESMSMPLNQHRSSKTIERRRSDVSHYNLKGDPPRSDGVKGRRPRDNFVTVAKLEEGSSGRQTREMLEGRGSVDANEKHILDAAENLHRNEIVEVREGLNDKFKDIYSNEVYSPERRRGKTRNGDEEVERYKDRSWKDANMDKRYGQSSNKNLLGPSRFSTDGGKSTKDMRASLERSNVQSLNSKSFEDNQRRGDIMQTASEPALDEVAVQAMVSILISYIKRFFTDSDFRTSLRENSFSSINFVDYEEGYKGDSKAISNLAEAIETVERAAEESGSANDLKKASLQLSIIKGLSSNDMKDGFTSGIPNVKLSACAHVYLSVIYKLQRKDKLSAKHLLKVFCISPFQARTILLPELWDSLFLPHLSHLKRWYTEEADSLRDNSVKSTKLRLLEKVYNEILDSGTYRFALYYIDWLTEGVEAPPVPSIHIPSVSVRGVRHGSSDSYTNSSEWASPADSFSPQPMVSKRLYEAVFSHSNKPGVEEVGDDEDEDDNVDNCIRTSDGSVSAFEEKKAVTYSSKSLEHTSQEMGECSSSTDDSQDNAALKEDDLETKEELHGVHVPGKSVLTIETGELHTLQEISLTFETGQTFEREAISEWFEEGNKRGNPLTGTTLQYPDVALTNIVLKRVMDSCNSDCCRHSITSASHAAENSVEDEFKPKDETSVFILEQLPTGLSEEGKITNAKHFIPRGVLYFLIWRFEFGNLEEKIHVAGLLFDCIEAEPGLKYEVAIKINKQCLLNLLDSKQGKARTNAVRLLTELVCLNRRKDAKIFLSSLQKEGIMDSMHVLLLYLQSSPPDEWILVATLLLHFDLLLEPRKYSIYREEAVDAIIMALDGSMIDEKIRAKCCRALLILGGSISISGKVTTDTWILRQAGYNVSSQADVMGSEGSLLENSIVLDGEEQAREEWLKSLSASLLGSGRKSFLDTISKCLASKSLELVRACLTTVAWLSRALFSLSNAEFQLSAFSALISQLKESLENSKLVEDKILASISLLNFSKIPECRVLLMSIADEIAVPLLALVETTWTAKELYHTLSRGNNDLS